jgi:hypothetical protein
MESIMQINTTYLVMINNAFSLECDAEFHDMVIAKLHRRELFNEGFVEGRHLIRIVEFIGDNHTQAATAFTEACKFKVLGRKGLAAIATEYGVTARYL